MKCFLIPATLWDHVLLRSLSKRGALHNIFILVSRYNFSLWAFGRNRTLLQLLRMWRCAVRGVRAEEVWARFAQQVLMTGEAGDGS